MASECDIVVVGAGTNSLTAAAYMAKAGKNVLVLEKNEQCGGGAVSVELAPGFIHDTHATSFANCYNNPVIARDELGLLSRFGLEFGHWGAAFSTLFEDGSGLTTYKDLDRSCEEIAQISSRDAESYRSFATKCLKLSRLLGTGAATPPLPTGRFFSLLDESELGRELQGSFFASAWDVITHYFESPELRMHYFKWIAEAMEHPETKGTGVAMYSLIALVHSTDPVFPIGGAWSMTNALIRCIEHYGGTVRTGSEVVKVPVRSGAAHAVQLADGEIIEARDAVLACIHPWNLEHFIPEIEDSLKRELSWVRLSNHGAMSQQFSLTETPIYKADDQEKYRISMCVELMRRDEIIAMRKSMDDFRFGEIPFQHISPLVMNASLFDPSRVPQASNTALYLYHFAPLHLHGGGVETWETHRQSFADAIWKVFRDYTTNIDDSKVLARLIETPLDHHRHSASMMHGDIFGIGMPGQMMGRRPIPRLANYRVPGVERLYLVGPFMHPGGTITLGGRATAIAMYRDMGLDLNLGFEGL